jgi:hypothetical protein
VTARELRAELKTRRRTARRGVAQMRRELRERARALWPADRGKRRRRLLTLAALILLLLLLLLRDCQCEGGPAAPLVGPATPAVTRVGLPPPHPAQPILGRLERVRRPTFVEPPPTGRTWLDDFRLQVAARSPRLSECFRGSDSPGGLRWTCALSPTDGATSDHELEPLRGTMAVSPAQRTCLVRALSSPAYRLQAGAGAPSTPVRVSMVIEF